MISGTVQGVGFRYSAQREAKRLGVRGWVRNAAEGDVEVLAEGESEALAAFREWLGEGPAGAWISSVSVERREATGYYSEFTIEY